MRERMAWGVGPLCAFLMFLCCCRCRKRPVAKLSIRRREPPTESGRAVRKKFRLIQIFFLLCSATANPVLGERDVARLPLLVCFN